MIKRNCARVWTDAAGRTTKDMKAKRKSLIAICVTVVLVALIALLGIFGMNIPGTKYRVMALSEKISLGLDLRGGIYAVYQGDTSAEDFNAKMDSTVTIMRNRLTNEGYTEANITRQGEDRIRIEIPDVDDPNQILEIVGTPAHLEFIAPDGSVVIEGKDVVEAAALSDNSNGGLEYMVRLKLTDEGSKSFADATAANVGQAITIKLDDTVISSPRVQSAIPEGSDAFITGNFEAQEALTLAGLITSGALPLDIEMLEVSAISATLGVDALHYSLIAGIIGVCLVMLFMILRYRLPGLMSCISLSAYIVIVFFAVALIPGVQLTLPGIAGILLGVGMAVDANVIIFERFRDEVNAGRSIESAAERGFHNALSAIIDSNITTIIAGIVLMYFGTGSIKGFAITLTIGVVTSLITSVIVTRYLMRACVKLGFKKSAYAGAARESRFKSGKPFTGRFKTFAVISCVIIVVAILMNIFGVGMNYGIDFTGGSLLTYEVGEQFDVKDVQDALSAVGIHESQIAKAGSEETQLQVRVADLGENADDMRKAFEEELEKKYANLTYVNLQTVGAVAGRDLLQNALKACLIVFVCLLVYIAIRFDFKSGLAALIALLHDVLIMCAFMGFFRWAFPVNSPFVAAMLTIIGYSINNTIIIFDRIREKNKMAELREMSRMDIVEDSVRETFPRTVNTTLTTLFTLVPVFVLGVASIKEFTFPILVGMLAGVYSSMLLSGQIWATWMDRDSFAWFRNIFKKKGGNDKDYSKNVKKA